VALAQFMVILDVTVVNVALPEIGASLDLDRGTLTWVVTAYTMTLGGLLVLGGRIADLAGARAMFLLGLTIFTTASLTSGLATSGDLLVASRVGQGLGAALMSPAALSMLLQLFDGAERDRALRVWAALGGAGAAAGVMIGGALTSGPGWEWSFWINVPVGVLLLLTVPRVVPTLPRRATGRLDVPGAILGTGTVAAAIYGLTQAGESGWASTETLGSGAATLALGALFVWTELRVANPLIPLRMLPRTHLPGGLALMTIASAAMVSAFFLLSLLLQHAHGYSALETGMFFMPATMAVGAGAHLAGRALPRHGARAVAPAGLAMAAVGLALLGWASDRDAVLTGLLPGLVLASVGIGVAFVAATTSGLAGIDHHHSGVASGILTTGHELGASLGVALMSTLAASSLSVSGLADHAGSSLAGNDLGGYQQAFWVAAAGTALLAAVVGRLLPRERPQPGDHGGFAH
jgi:EmrB/QacA subfamily drug resistance transporter